MQKLKLKRVLHIVLALLIVLQPLPSARAVHVEARSVFLIVYPLSVGLPDRTYEVGAFFTLKQCREQLLAWTYRLNTDVLAIEGGAVVGGCYPVDL